MMRSYCHYTAERNFFMTERNITLDVLRTGEAEKLSAVRGDKDSRTFVFTLCHGGRMIVLDGDVTVLFCCEIDGLVMTDACDVIDGRAVYTLKNSFTAKAGTFPCELAVYKGSGDELKKLYCTGFELQVDDSFADLEGIEADDRYAALDVLVNRAESAALQVEKLLSEQKSLSAGYGITIEDGVISVAFTDGEAVAY